MQNNQCLLQTDISWVQGTRISIPFWRNIYVFTIKLHVHQRQLLLKMVVVFNGYIFLLLTSQWLVGESLKYTGIQVKSKQSFLTQQNSMKPPT